MRLLARREHAAAELSAKLEQRGFDHQAVAAELDRLAEAGLQSDERFLEQFVEQRVANGDGPIKLRAALAERGIDEARAGAALDRFESEWSERARAALERRFGPGRADTRAELARRMRFLQGRGFPAEIARYACEAGGLDPE